jgi:hypothetical protein
MYMAEAKCMLGKFAESLVHLDKAENVATESQVSNLVKEVEFKFRNIKVQSDAPQSPVEEHLTVAIINKLNRCVVDICSGNFEKARQKFDEVISSSVENGGLGLQEVTSESDSSQLLPAYVCSLLSYFYLRVKNLKMARAVVKSRRFVIDSDHLVQQVKQTCPSTQQPNSKYSKKPVALQNFKSISKIFT